jgi:hypothetical protein
MLRRARGTWAVLAFGSTVTVGLVFGTVCSVDRAGLSNGDASVSSGGSGGGISSTGLGGLGSGGGSGRGGNGSGRGGNVGSGGVGSESGIDSGAGEGGGAGGAAAGGTGGVSSGAGGSGATAGMSGAGGITGAGGQAATGDGGPTGAGGVTGDGGLTGTGGAIGTGGASGMGGDLGGTGGDLGTGGAIGTGGVTGTGGAVGTGGSHPPSCSPFPTGSSFTTPTDGLLHCYWIHSDTTDWDSSESRCVSEGGTLATILSSQENMFVFQLLLQAGLFKGDGVSLGATDGKANDDKSGAGQYAWVTGEPWGSYINWHMGQPDGSCMCQGANSCVCDHRMVMINDGTWYDRAASTARPYVCEAVAR